MKLKKLKNLPYKFFCIALSQDSPVCFEAYGGDRRRLGKAFLEVAKKVGFDLPKSDSNCYQMTIYLEELGVINRVKDGYAPSKNWIETVKGLFPKNTGEISSLTGGAPIVPVEEPVEEPQVQEEAAPEMEATPKNLFELYYKILKEIGTEYVPSKSLKSLFEDLYRSMYGESPICSWWSNRKGFLERNLLIEGISDEKTGGIVYLRSNNWEDILNSKKSDVRLLKELVIPTQQTTATSPADVEVEEKTVVVETAKEEKNDEEECICVCVKKEDVHKLFVERVRFESDSDSYIILDIKPVQANLDVLKVLEDVKISKGDKDRLRVLFSPEIDRLQESLMRIVSLCK